MNVEKKDVEKLIGEVFLFYILRQKKLLEDKVEPVDYNSEHTPFLMRVMHKRLEYVNKCLLSTEQFVIVPDEFYLIISVMANSPACALMMLHHLLESAVKRSGAKLKQGYIIDEQDFAAAFPFYYDACNVDSDRIYWENIWHNQKDNNGNNKIDKFEYWKDLFDVDN